MSHRQVSASAATGNAGSRLRPRPATGEGSGAHGGNRLGGCGAAQVAGTQVLVTAFRPTLDGPGDPVDDAAERHSEGISDRVLVHLVSLWSGM